VQVDVLNKLRTKGGRAMAGGSANVLGVEEKGEEREKREGDDLLLLSLREERSDDLNIVKLLFLVMFAPELFLGM